MQNTINSVVGWFQEVLLKGKLHLQLHLFPQVYQTVVSLKGWSNCFITLHHHHPHGLLVLCGFLL